LDEFIVLKENIVTFMYYIEKFYLYERANLFLKTLLTADNEFLTNKKRMFVLEEYNNLQELFIKSKEMLEKLKDALLATDLNKAQKYFIISAKQIESLNSNIFLNEKIITLTQKVFLMINEQNKIL
jgi:hypothetical protein